MSGITLHPRYFVVRHGALDISEAIIATAAKYDLTEAEVLGILIEQSGRWHKPILRMERHGTIEKKADEA